MQHRIYCLPRIRSRMELVYVPIKCALSLRTCGLFQEIQEGKFISHKSIKKIFLSYSPKFKTISEVTHQISKTFMKPNRWNSPLNWHDTSKISSSALNFPTIAEEILSSSSRANFLRNHRKFFLLLHRRHTFNIRQNTLKELSSGSLFTYFSLSLPFADIFSSFSFIAAFKKCFCLNYCVQVACFCCVPFFFAPTHTRKFSEFLSRIIIALNLLHMYESDCECS